MAGKIETRQDSDGLVFYEGAGASVTTSGHPLLRISPTEIKIGTTTSDVDLKVLLGSGTEFVLFDVGNSRLAIAAPLVPAASDGAALGTTSLMWSDLFLASGAVINWNNSGITLTHSTTGKLTLASTWDTAAATGRPFLVQLNVDNVRLGSYANAFKAYVVCDESGSSQGVLSVANFEISMPSTGGGEGVYTCTEHEMVCPSGYNSSGCIASFMYFNSAGSGEAEFDSTGDFFHIDTGISAGSGKVLSTTSQTLRVGLGANAGTKRYLVMSQLEDGLGLGVTGTPMVLTSATTKAIHIYCDTAVTGASTRVSAVEINLNRITSDGGTTNARDWALKVNLTSDYKYPNCANAIYGAMTLVQAGVHGRAAAVQAELIMPNNQLTRGTFSCLHLDMTCGSSTNVGSSGPLSFMSLNMETSATEMDRAGYLFEIVGFSEGNDKFCDNGGTPAAADGGIRFLLNGNVRYLLYANDAES